MLERENIYSNLNSSNEIGECNEFLCCYGQPLNLCRFRSLPVFLYIKPPDEATLGELLPNDMIWTEGLGGSKEAYLKASDKLIQCTDGLYVLQKSLIETLLQNNDNDGDLTASSRKIFVNKIKTFVKENSLEQQVSAFPIEMQLVSTSNFLNKIGEQNSQNLCKF